MVKEEIASPNILMLRWPRSGPRRIHQDKVNLLKHTLRGSLRSHLRVRISFWATEPAHG